MQCNFKLNIRLSTYYILCFKLTVKQPSPSVKPVINHGWIVGLLSEDLSIGDCEYSVEYSLLRSREQPVKFEAFCRWRYLGFFLTLIINEPSPSTNPVINQERAQLLFFTGFLKTRMEKILKKIIVITVNEFA